LEFRILGPLEVRDGSRGLELGGSKQRALLGVLLLNANAVVGSERLVDELWGESPPQTSGKLVHQYVSNLRKILGGDELVTRPPGYLLRVEPGERDLLEFSRLTDEARLAAPADASNLLRTALELWRGSPLADLRFAGAAASEVARLEDLRLAVLLERAEYDLALGRHADVSRELDALAGEHPYEERLRAPLMLALYRSGRQADALRVYQEFRCRLVEDLGLEPGRELKQLEQAILVQDAVLDPPATVRARVEDAVSAQAPEPEPPAASQAGTWNRHRARVVREALWVTSKQPVNVAIVAAGAVLGLVVSGWVALVAGVLYAWRLGVTVRAVRNWHALDWVAVRARSLTRIAPDGELRSHMHELVSACVGAARLGAAAEDRLGRADRRVLRRRLERSREQYDLDRADSLARQIGALDRVASERRRLREEAGRIDAMLDQVRGPLYRARIESSDPSELATTLQSSLERIRGASASLGAALEDARRFEVGSSGAPSHPAQGQTP
jgi:DNA-binding SARP family transcriptional activator